MSGIANSLAVPMLGTRPWGINRPNGLIPQLRRRQERLVMSPVQLELSRGPALQHQADLVHSALQLPSGYQAAPALPQPSSGGDDEAQPALQQPFLHSALQLPSGYPAAPALPLPSSGGDDEAQPALQLPFLHQALQLPSGYPAAPALPLPSSGGDDEAQPAAPRSEISGIAANTLFTTLISVFFSAAVALTVYHLLQRNGNSAVAAASPSPLRSSPTELTVVCVTLVLCFAFTAAGACLYNRSPVAAYISGNVGFLFIALSFFSTMHLCVPGHLVWLVWTTGGILLLVFAYFFAQGLKDYYVGRHRRGVTSA